MTDTVTIWHNPRCSKSRETLALLEENGVSAAVMLYLDTPPSVAEIKTLLKKLAFDDARKLMRTKEALYSELGLADVTDQDALIQAMHDNPKLIERPVVVNGKHARLGRPPEQVLEIIS
ncbi:arsenate reductase (glutaredoxin) [Morganella psychrotolerans]|uniref:Arsenate reductase n=1 Tax=Morganella psychrotolerans TaxID=368603 RepID=A0A1B8HU65_9GAMM|nr:arsenate reductase (glutaredoxin) [Morganella psychrotolerans]OBU13410.1 arsenate reductase (glutaredoxin) [Morganella psychrotolerans]